jgi:hypothetical protein
VLDTDSFLLRDRSPAHRFLEIGFIVYFFRFPIKASLSLVNVARNCQIIQSTMDLTRYSYSDRNNVYAKSTMYRQLCIAKLIESCGATLFDKAI